MKEEPSYVKEHIYRRIFNNDFNLEFHKPRKYTCLRCDKQEKIVNPSHECTLKHEQHLQLLKVTDDLERALQFIKLRENLE